MVRAAIPEAIIEGPSVASGPGGGWFSAFLDYAKANDVVPDYIGWHEAGGGVDPVRDADSVRSSLASRGIQVENLSISEYGSPPEQNPGHSAWYISRIERANVDALRSNWGMGGGLYGGMGDLVTRNWEPLGQWWIYKRYADQTGLRTDVTPDDQIDAVAFQDSAAKKMTIVVGNRGGAQGAVNVTVTHVAPWLQENGMTRVLLEKMPEGSTPVEAPTVVSDAPAEVACNSLTVTIDWSEPNDGYALTLTQN
jgi:hypothetical protein